MNVELVNPISVLRLFEGSNAARPQSSDWRAPAWAKPLWARLGEQMGYQRALHQLHQLDDRDFDDLAIARADFPAPAGRDGKGLCPLQRA